MTDVLYHYCDVETFLNIIRNKTIRLSDITKSNDYMEGKWLFTLVEEEVLRQYKENPFLLSNKVIYGLDELDTIKYLLKLTLDKILKQNEMLFYVSCFSEAADKLSQWRGYADDGKGLAIGFNAKILSEIASKENLLKLKKVTYSIDTLPEQVSKYAQSFLESINFSISKNKMREIYFDDDYMMNFFHYLDTKLLIQESLFYKNPAFAEEEEWRLVLNEEENELDKYSTDWDYWYSTADNKSALTGYFGEVFPDGLQFRSSNSTISSYLDLSFKGFESEIINNIYIGPKSNLERNDIDHLLKYYGYGEEIEEINKSDSTYR
ncbi:DUF2971 domain-containing protein [Paenibacillus sp. PK1-4R]|uniref:DUF2971 domain-containing protein n=1 Tax=Paenibacillus sp. PK1-4R TaxID=3049075 RepID=UPI0025A1991C|nr:DUF2971 domain-containing protein [Paenibacillus sp. PK1-4R]WJM05892.1 DUF2971 domain-containing protein [Paenibacillus sp. PK1-4R]